MRIYILFFITFLNTSYKIKLRNFFRDLWTDFDWVYILLDRLSIKWGCGVDIFPKSTIFSNNISDIGNFIPVRKQMSIIIKLRETNSMWILNKFLNISIDFITFLKPLYMSILFFEYFLILVISLVSDCALLVVTFILFII